MGRKALGDKMSSGKSVGRKRASRARREGVIHRQAQMESGVEWKSISGFVRAVMGTGSRVGRRVHRDVMQHNYMFPKSTRRWAA